MGGDLISFLGYHQLPRLVPRPSNFVFRPPSQSPELLFCVPCFHQSVSLCTAATFYRGSLFCFLKKGLLASLFLISFPCYLVAISLETTSSVPSPGNCRASGPTAPSSQLLADLSGDLSEEQGWGRHDLISQPTYFFSAPKVQEEADTVLPTSGFCRSYGLS